MVVVQTRVQSLFFFFITFCGVFFYNNLEEKSNTLYRNTSFKNLLKVIKYLYILFQHVFKNTCDVQFFSVLITVRDK